ncbi:MAG: PilZ domain-containing protein [Planctomycetota bacterium]
MVRSIEATARFYVKVGIEFINSGDLYSQLDDQLGKYFNRRETDRIKVGPGHLSLRLSRKAIRLQATMHDLSELGIGAWVDHVQAAKLAVGDMLKFRLKSREDNGTVHGRVKVARKEMHGAKDYIGLVFVPSEHSSKEDLLLDQFIQDFLKRRLRWADSA